MKVGSSISVSFWLRMPGHVGAGSRSRNGLFCVPWAGRTRAVAPCLLCEVLAVILVLGGRCGASAHPCEATASGLWSLGSSPPSTGSVVAVLVLGCPVLLAWTYHCFSLGAWSLDLASSSVACIPSPFHGLARCGGLCMSPLFEMLSVLFPGNIGSHFLGSVVPSSVTFDSFSSSSSKHLHARAHTEERVGVLVWVFIHQLHGS